MLRGFLIPLLLLIVLGARGLASFVIDYHWWREMGQVDTWVSLLVYAAAPAAAGVVFTFAVLWFAQARAVAAVRAPLHEAPLYSRIAAVVLAVASLIITTGAIDNWTTVRYLAGRGTNEGAWKDQVFGLPLSFYLFELPFYADMIGYALALSLAAAIVFAVASTGWRLWRERSSMGMIELDQLGLERVLTTGFVRIAGTLFFLALAVRFFLGRYQMLLDDHGFMVGVDYVADHVTLPLNWVRVIACLGAGIALSFGRWRLAGILAALMVLQNFIPGLVNAVYVRPNEITLQRPYIGRHIEATRAAFGLSATTREIEFPAQLETRIDLAKHQPLFDNVRLWDWRAFHDTVTQIQALRPYYVFQDSDVDRYVIDGRLRQVLLTPRELDIRALPDARTRWINPHFIYTHGYGMVMASASRISPEGLPVLFVQDAPPAVKAGGLKLTRPEIYYGEVVHEPVFVRTTQPEFNYPSGSDNVHTRYEGRGGFPVGSLGVRFAAALSEFDWNILLTGVLSAESRMMIHRRVGDRLRKLAGFLTWDDDPYLVLTSEGRLVWIVDAYTTSEVHPYSRPARIPGAPSVNYIRNSVKATVDAYDGTVALYIFDEADPILRAYRTLFPKLFAGRDAMPEDLHRHVRYPETIFRVQAEIYRTFHMRDPGAFYNKEDLWDPARTTGSVDARPQAVEPTYVVAELPGGSRPEFLLIMPFTPRSKDNMIGLMVARCDAEHLGELVFLQLSKQALVFGPMQIEARINQDQNISKDLTLWNQQGSQVLRGQMLVLPVENTFLYLQSIYIQSQQARMPQLKKIAMAMGNSLIYTDTYDQAVAELAGLRFSAAASAAEGASPAASTAPSPAAGADADRRLEAIRNHLRRYRELVSQGKFVEAGKELEALEAQAARR